MAKFMAASRMREWMPAWAVPWGLQAKAVGVQVPSTQPRSSPSTPYEVKAAPTSPITSMPPSPSQRSMSFPRPVTGATVASGCLLLREGRENSQVRGVTAGLVDR